jgi:hypothetical protein
VPVTGACGRTRGSAVMTLISGFPRAMGPIDHTIRGRFRREAIAQPVTVRRRRLRRWQP